MKSQISFQWTYKCILQWCGSPKKKKKQFYIIDQKTSLQYMLLLENCECHMHVVSNTWVTNRCFRIWVIIRTHMWTNMCCKIWVNLTCKPCVGSSGDLPCVTLLPNVAVLQCVTMLPCEGNSGESLCYHVLPCVTRLPSCGELVTFPMWEEQLQHQGKETTGDRQWFWGKPTSFFIISNNVLISFTLPQSTAVHSWLRLKFWTNCSESDSICPFSLFISSSSLWTVWQMFIHLIWLARRFIWTLCPLTLVNMGSFMDVIWYSPSSLWVI